MANVLLSVARSQACIPEPSRMSTDAVMLFCSRLSDCTRCAVVSHWPGGCVYIYPSPQQILPARDNTAHDMALYGSNGPQGHGAMGVLIGTYRWLSAGLQYHVQCLNLVIIAPADVVATGQLRDGATVKHSAHCGSRHGFFNVSKVPRDPEPSKALNS